MTRDQVINNLRHAMPRVYTMTVAHGLRAYAKKTGVEDVSLEAKTMIEAVAEGFTYTFVPVLAALLIELDAADAEITPPTEDNARNPDGTPYVGTPGGPSTDIAPEYG